MVESPFHLIILLHNCQLIDDQPMNSIACLFKSFKKSMQPFNFSLQLLSKLKKKIGKVNKLDSTTGQTAEIGK